MELKPCGDSLVQVVVQMSLYSFLYSVTLVPCTYECYMIIVCFSLCLSLLFQLWHKAMANVLNFSGKTPSQRMCLKPMAGPAIGSMAIQRTCQFEQNKRDALQHCIYVKRKAENKQLNDHRLFPVMAAAQRSSGIYPSSPSPSDTIKKFYKCINEKNLKQLGDYISEDCYIEECSFNTPLQGKKVNDLCSS